MIFAVVEEVGEVECYEGEVVRCIDAGVYVLEKPAVIVHETLFDGGLGRQSCVTGTKESSWCIDVVAFVELALQVR